MPLKENKITIPIEIQISRDAYEKLAAAKRTQGDTYLTGVALSSMCSQLIDVYSNGGVMVKPDNLKLIEDACGKAIQNDTQLVSEVQKVKGRQEGEYVLSVPIPAAIWPAVVDAAQAIGETPEAIAQNIAVRAIVDSLGFYIDKEAVVYLTDQESKELKRLTGKKTITGADILKLVGGKQEVAA